MNKFCIYNISVRCTQCYFSYDISVTVIIFFSYQFQLFLFFLFQLVLQLFIFSVTVTVILTRGISVHMTVSLLYTHEQHRAQTSQLPQFLYCILLASKLNVTFTKLYNVNLLIVLAVHF
jgi:hypothetical protein